MSDFTNAINALDRVPYVLQIRRSTPTSACVVLISRDDTETRARIDQILKKYREPYQIEVADCDPKRAEEVHQLALLAKGRTERRQEKPSKLPAHVRRPRRPRPRND